MQWLLCVHAQNQESALKPSCTFQHHLEGLLSAAAWAGNVVHPQASIQRTPAFRLPSVLQPCAHRTCFSSSAPTKLCSHLHTACGSLVSIGVTSIQIRTSEKQILLMCITPKGLAPNLLRVCVCKLCQQYHQQQLTHEAEPMCLPTCARHLTCPHSKPATSYYSHFIAKKLRVKMAKKLA